MLAWMYLHSSRETEVGTCAAPLRTDLKKTILIGSNVYGSDHPHSAWGQKGSAFVRPYPRLG